MKSGKFFTLRSLRILPLLALAILLSGCAEVLRDGAISGVRDGVSGLVIGIFNAVFAGVPGGG